MNETGRPRVDLFFRELRARIEGTSKVEHPPDSREMLALMEAALERLARADLDGFEEKLVGVADEWGIDLGPAE